MALLYGCAGCLTHNSQKRRFPARAVPRFSGLAIPGGKNWKVLLLPCCGLTRHAEDETEDAGGAADGGVL
jgi:hypothetical protein